MMDEYPGNSRRPIVNTEKTTLPIEEPKLEKVVTGRVVRRKKPIGRRLMDTFFSADGVVGYIANEVLIPALKNLATDMVTQGIEKAVYGEVRTPANRTVRGSALPRTHISYDRYNTRPAPSAPAMRRPITQPSALDIEEIILGTKIEAQVVVDKLYETLEQYGSATVANLNDLIGQSSAYTDHKWGWNNLNEMTVKRVREGYLLILPEPEDLR